MFEKEELKPIDPSKYKITETGQVLKMTKEELEREKCELLGIIQGKDKVIQELEKENAELKANKQFLNNLVREKEQRGLEIQEDLLRENEKLKEQCLILADCNTCHSTCKNKNIEVKKQFTKAKELIAELEKENAQLKSKNCWKTCEYAEPKSQWISQHIQDVVQLTKAKEIIKDYLTIVKGSHITVCGVSEENRTIYVLKLNEEAEQFIKE